MLTSPKKLAFMENYSEHRYLCIMFTNIDKRKKRKTSIPSYPDVVMLRLSLPSLTMT